MAKRVELTEEQKIEILRRSVDQDNFTIKKEMGLPNGQQIAGVIGSQYTKTGKYLLAKAGLQPTRPPKQARKDLEPAPQGGQPSSISEALGPPPAPKPQEAAPNQLPHEQPIQTGGNPPDRWPRSNIQPVASPLAPSFAGFRRDGTTDRYDVYREEPYDAFVGSKYSTHEEIGGKCGGGKFRIERWIPGRLQPEVQRIYLDPVVYGPPRVPEGSQQMTMPMPQQESASQMANAITNAIKTGADIAKDQKPEVKAAEPRAVDKAIEKVVEKAMDQALNPVPQAQTNGFSWQDYVRIREQERKDEADKREQERTQRAEDDRRRRDDEKLAHEHRMTEQAEKHRQDMERLKSEYDLKIKEQDIAQKAREDAAAAHAKEMRELNDQKIQWAMDKAEKAAEEANAALEANEAKLTEKVAEMSKVTTAEQERNRAEMAKEREHLEKMIEKDREALATQKGFQEQLIEIKKNQLTVSDNKLIEFGERLLTEVSTIAKQIVESQNAVQALNAARNAAAQATPNQVLRNAQTLNNIAQAAPKPAGDVEMTSKIGQIARTEAFQSFMDDWCGMVAEGEEAAVLFDSIQRRYRRDDQAVSELVDFIAGRNWAKAKAMILPHVDDEQKKVLELPYAEPYYEQMRYFVKKMMRQGIHAWDSFEVMVQQQPAEQPVEDAVEPAALPSDEPAPAPEAQTGQPT
ncbi:MAG: hypothetical protein A3E01_07895 [Gammaproteobacteria bacterium RIFCSPHIGHO2_12_FULL_63_22]|nr:MAG: hypothetical protein A3E01_07895 [Gammaproteobacteria bacterium RIFCSPHIGHO2_12_FULL_63_22]